MRTVLVGLWAKLAQSKRDAAPAVEEMLALVPQVPEFAARKGTMALLRCLTP